MCRQRCLVPASPAHSYAYYSIMLITNRDERCWSIGPHYVYVYDCIRTSATDRANVCCAFCNQLSLIEKYVRNFQTSFGCIASAAAGVGLPLPECASVPSCNTHLRSGDRGGSFIAHAYVRRQTRISNTLIHSVTTRAIIRRSCTV